tara:strand:- start:3 stop:467 length:465 start_codon:yes stop_codon:yes gene_type:complete
MDKFDLKKYLAENKLLKITSVNEVRKPKSIYSPWLEGFNVNNATDYYGVWINRDDFGQSEDDKVKKPKRFELSNMIEEITAGMDLNRFGSVNLFDDRRRTGEYFLFMESLSAMRKVVDNMKVVFNSKKSYDIYGPMIFTSKGELIQGEENKIHR